MRRFGFVAAVITLLITTGCGLLPIPPTPSPTPTPPGLSEPLSFRQVMEVRPAPCPSAGKNLVLPEPDNPQSCLVLGPSRLTVDQLEQVSIESGQNGSWMLLITLRSTDAATLEQVTTELAAAGDPTNRMAMIVGEELITAPSVQGPIPGGRLQLVGSFTRDEIDALAKRLGG